METNRGNRVLLVHNRYQFAGGEDTVVRQDQTLLEEKGWKVVLYERNNEELKTYTKLQKLLLPLTTIFSLKSYREIRQLIRKEQIQVVHVHNTLPLISLSCYYAAKREKVKLVQTIHNFRFVCPNALCYRDGHICEECMEQGLWNAVRYGCYRNSKAQTLMVVVMLQIHRWLGTFGKPDAYIALTQFNKKMISTVSKPEKIYVKPNYLQIDDTDRQIVEGLASKSYYVYAARLESVKGIFVVLDAFRRLPQEQLVILGTGPQQEEVEQYVAKHNMTNVSVCGFTPHDKVLDYMKYAKATIFPSLWYEGFPMTIVESMACATPVIVSNTPNLTEVIKDGDNGYAFQTGDATELQAVVAKYAQMSQQEYEALQQGAQECYEAMFTKEKVFQQLMKIYEVEHTSV